MVARARGRVAVRRRTRARPQDHRAAAEEGWTADRLGAVERNVLRVAIEELDAGEVPARMTLDEAVSLAKRYAPRRGWQTRERDTGTASDRETETLSDRRVTEPGGRAPRAPRGGEHRAGTDRAGGGRVAGPGARDPRRAVRAREGGRGGARAARSARRRPMPKPDELRALVEDVLDGLELWPQLHGQAESVRYSITAGQARAAGDLPRDRGGCRRRAGAGAGRRVARSSSCTRSRSCTTTCRRSTTTRSGAGSRRRGSSTGRPSAILAGDALLAEAFRLATSYDTPLVARELAQATLGMIGGQYLDITARRRRGDAAQAQDGLPLRGVGGGSHSGRRGFPRASRAVARVRRRARAAVPDRRRHPRRRRLRRPTASRSAPRSRTRLQSARGPASPRSTRTRASYRRSSPGSQSAPRNATPNAASIPGTTVPIRHPWGQTRDRPGPVPRHVPRRQGACFADEAPRWIRRDRVRAGNHPELLRKSHRAQPVLDCTS